MFSAKIGLYGFLLSLVCLDFSSSLHAQESFDDSSLSQPLDLNESQEEVAEEEASTPNVAADTPAPEVEATDSEADSASDESIKEPEEKAPSTHQHSIDTLRSRLGFEDTKNPTYTGAQLAIVLKQTKFLEKSTQLVGARYLFSFWENFLLGLSFDMTSGSVKDDAAPELSYDFKSQGLVAGFTLFPRAIGNLSLLCGAGVGRQTLEGAPTASSPANHRWEAISYLAPGVLFEIHVTEYVRLGFSYSQRMVTPKNGDDFGYSAADLSGSELGFSLNIAENYRAGTSIR